ncbi:MAG TPA: restriction endonuclease subunit S [Nitrospira sp.]|nr:restriction endonuclease subunit S [Nitrospira sp.]
MNDLPLRRLVLDACDGPFGSAIKSEHYAEEGARVIRLGNIGTGEWRDDSKAFLSLDYWRQLSGHHARAGDLIMAGLGDVGHPVGRACVVPDYIGQALVKADCYRMRLNPNLADARFIAAFLSSHAGLGQTEALAEGSTRQRLTLSKAMSIRVPQVPISMQRSVADLLDVENARIDTVIAKKRRMIELLLARRVATAFQAVSGRLGDHSSFKGSSIPWLNEVPNHWKEVLLRLVTELGSGHTPSRDHPEWWIDCTVPWITTGEVQLLRSDRIEYIEETREKISEIGLANSSAELHPADTVVLCRTASAGYSGIMKTPMATSQDFATWVCGRLLRPRFLLLCLRAMREDLLGRLAMGSTHKTIYMPDIRSIQIPLPSVEEQDQIIKEAWCHLARIDKVTVRLEHQIKLLQEHRQALITAAVTGELEISGRPSVGA